MTKRTIVLKDFVVCYRRYPKLTEMEMYNYDDLLAYGVDSRVSLKQIAEEQVGELSKYMNKEADYDDYYDRYDPEFLRDAMDTLNKLIEQEG